MEKGRIEFDDPAFKARVSSLSPEVEALRRALENAPHKHRIDFQAYWDWYDGPRAKALAGISKVISEAILKK